MQQHQPHSTSNHDEHQPPSNATPQRSMTRMVLDPRATAASAAAAAAAARPLTRSASMLSQQPAASNSTGHTHPHTTATATAAKMPAPSAANTTANTKDQHQGEAQRKAAGMRKHMIRSGSVLERLNSTGRGLFSLSRPSLSSTSLTAAGHLTPFLSQQRLSSFNKGGSTNNSNQNSNNSSRLPLSTASLAGSGLGIGIGVLSGIGLAGMSCSTQSAAALTASVDDKLADSSSCLAHHHHHHHRHSGFDAMGSDSNNSSSSSLCSLDSVDSAASSLADECAKGEDEPGMPGAHHRHHDDGVRDDTQSGSQGDSGVDGAVHDHAGNCSSDGGDVTEQDLNAVLLSQLSCQPGLDLDDVFVNSVFDCCSQGQTCAVQRILSEQPHLLGKRRSADGAQLLHAASAGGHTDLVMHLVDLGADVCATTRRLQTPLHLAARGNHARVVEALLEDTEAAQRLINSSDDQGLPADLPGSLSHGRDKHLHPCACLCGLSVC